MVKDLPKTAGIDGQEYDDAVRTSKKIEPVRMMIYQYLNEISCPQRLPAIKRFWAAKRRAGKAAFENIKKRIKEGF